MSSNVPHFPKLCSWSRSDMLEKSDTTGSHRKTLKRVVRPCGNIAVSSAAASPALKHAAASTTTQTCATTRWNLSGLQVEAGELVEAGRIWIFLNFAPAPNKHTQPWGSQLCAYCFVPIWKGLGWWSRLALRAGAKSNRSFFGISCIFVMLLVRTMMRYPYLTP